MRNEFIVSKYTWLVFEDIKNLLIESPKIYIPYNCQFLMIKNSTTKNDSYILNEIYYPSFKSYDLFDRYFGTWEKNQGLENSQPDFYERRLDMNGTTLFVKYTVSIGKNQYRGKYFIFICFQ